MRVLEIVVQQPTRQNFSIFGQFIQKPDNAKPTLENEFLQFFGELAFWESEELEFGICTFRHRPFATRELEQHKHTKELLYAIDGDFWLPVVPLNGDGTPKLEDTAVFHVKAGEGVILNEAIWHWAPYALGESASILVGFRKGTAVNDLFIRNLDTEIRMVERKP